MHQHQKHDGLNNTWIVWPLALVFLVMGMGCRGECDIHHPDEVRFFNGCGGTSMAGHDLSGETLVTPVGEYFDIRYTSFYGANLSNAHLGGAYLEGVDLTQANLEGANLTDVAWADAICPDGTHSKDVGFSCCEHLNGAVPSSCSAQHGKDRQGENSSGHFMVKLKAYDVPWFYRANLTQVNYSNTQISKGNFMDADLTNAVMSNAWLQKSLFRYATLTGANLFGADLRDALLDHADLQNANFENANLTGATLNESNLSGANLHGAKLSHFGWNKVICPDGTHSSDNNNSCCGHLNGAVPSHGCL